MLLLRAWLTLVWLSFQRLLWSSTTFMVMFPLVGAALFLSRWRQRLTSATFGGDFQHSLIRFTDSFVILIFLSILLPICALAFATASLGDEREERTLVFVLMRPIPRWLILMAKLTATLPLVVGVVAGSFYGYCQLAGPVGREAFERYLPAVLCTTLAYVGLFQLFAVMFRHSTIAALVYALFAEPLMAAMPGRINRLAIAYYGRSLIDHGIVAAGSRSTNWIVPVDSPTAVWTLLTIALGTLTLAAVIFQRREYRDLT